MTSHFLNENGTARSFARYSFANRDVKRGGIYGTNIEDAAALIQREVESNSQTTSLTGLSIRYDSRNDRITPTGGKIADLGVDFAGLGGFSKYARLESSAAAYMRNPRWLPTWLPSAERGVWVVGGRMGMAYPFNTLDDFDLPPVDPRGDGSDTPVPDLSAEVRSLQYIDRNLELPLSERYFVGGRRRQLEQRLARAVAQPGRRVERDQPPPVHQRQAMAVLGLLHVVGGHEDRRPGVGEGVDQVPEAAA